MKAYHRIVGDPPSCGFRDNLASVGFPAASWAATKNRRLPKLNDFPTNLPPGLNELQCSYELQSLDFDHMAVVMSREGLGINHQGRPLDRPHGYSHIVALAGDADDRTAATTAEALSFDGFMPLSEFWAISMERTALDVTDWQPGAGLPAWQGNVPAAMREAMVLRYWRALSARAFAVKDEIPRPVRVCLPGDNAPAGVIEQSKRFLLTVLEPALPAACSHILSMSANVRPRQLQLYTPTALAFIVPENNDLGIADDMLFDLRSGRFEPISEQETQFIRLVMGGGMPDGMNALYAQCQRLFPTTPDQQDTPFMADFHLAWAMYRLQTEQLAQPARAALWREVHSRLTVRHGFDAVQADALLAPLEEKLFLSGMTGEAPLTADDVRFLLGKVLRLDSETLSVKYREVLTAHQKARMEPFFAQVLTLDMLQESFSDDRVQNGVYNVLLKAHVTPPLEESQLQFISGEGFSALCQQCPPLRGAVEDFLKAFSRQNPDKAMFIMPLAIRYLNRTEVLANSLRLLQASYVAELPGAEVCSRISGASDAFEPETRAMLEDYLISCFRAHHHEPQALVEVCAMLGQDMTGVMSRILASDTDPANTVPVPLDNRMLDTLLRGLRPLCRDPQTLHDSLMAYVSRNLDKSLQNGQNAFVWLLGVDSANTVIHPAERRSAGLDYYALYHYSVRAVPEQNAHLQVMAWLGELSPQERTAFEAGFKRLYEALRDEGRAQLTQLLPYFSSTVGYDYVTGVYIAGLQDELRSGWKRGEYFAPIDMQRSRWPKGGVTAEVLLDADVTQHARERLHRWLGAFDQPRHFAEAARLANQKPRDAFNNLMRTELNSFFAARYEQLLMSRATLTEAGQVKKLGDDLGAQSLVAATPAQNCLSVMQGVNDFIRNTLPMLEDERIAPECMRRAQQVLSLGGGDLPGRMKGWVYHEALMSAEGGAALPLRKRLAAAIMLCVMPDGRFHAERVLGLLDVPEKAYKQPYELDNLSLLSHIAMLFALAEKMDPAYPASLRQGLERGPWADYTQRVRAQKKEAVRLIPWLGNSGMPMRQAMRPTQAFIEWLAG